ncbi:MAG: hypothetical protein ABSH20_16985 [Tepidisphaeraceae bacterium]|jgi:hypothetical protein
MVASIQAKELVALHGEVRPQPSHDWTGPFPIPLAVECYYREIGPADVYIRYYGNPYFLPCLSKLWEFQAGYRWDGLSGEPITNWPDDWLVVADEGGDPFIFSRSSGVILHAYHGEGVWDAGEIFPDLNTMAACLAGLGAIALEAGKELTDDDCNIRPMYRKRALVRLRALLGSTLRAERVLRVLS